MTIEQRRGPARVEVVYPLEHRADMTLKAGTDPGGTGALDDVSQGQQALPSTRVDRLQA